MSDSIEIFAKVNDYVERRITLWDLESWLVPRLLIYFEHPDSAVGQLASTIELCLAELNGGIISERSVRTRLRNQIGHSRMIWAPYTQSEHDIITSAANIEHPLTNFEHSLPGQSQSWNSELEVANV